MTITVAECTVFNTIVDTLLAVESLPQDEQDKFWSGIEENSQTYTIVQNVQKELSYLKAMAPTMLSTGVNTISFEDEYKVDLITFHKSSCLEESVL